MARVSWTEGREANPKGRWDCNKEDLGKQREICLQPECSTISQNYISEDSGERSIMSRLAG
jgi:hypothetical protein